MEHDNPNLAGIRHNVLTRRHWLATSAAAFAAALPIRVSAAPPVGPVMAKLSAYMNEAGDHSLPADVIEQTKLHVLDTLAAMVSGSDLPPARAILAFARANPGDRTTPVVGSPLLCGAVETTLAIETLPSLRLLRPLLQRS